MCELPRHVRGPVVAIQGSAGPGESRTFRINDFEPMNKRVKRQIMIAAGVLVGIFAILALLGQVG
jgi:hypothetical protein